MLCEKIFTRHSYIALLENVPSPDQSELVEALQICSNPPITDSQLSLLSGCNETYSLESDDQKWTSKPPRRCITDSEEYNLLRFKTPPGLRDKLTDLLLKILNN